MKSFVLVFSLLATTALFAQQDTTAKEEFMFGQQVETLPEYPGGPAAQARYLMTNVSYPEEARELGVSGRTYISFVVDVDGSVVDAKVARSSHPILDAEALRAVKAMKGWKPGTQRGKPVKVQFTLPISFNLPEPIESDKPKRKRKRKNKG